MTQPIVATAETSASFSSTPSRPFPVARATLVGEIRPSEPNIMYSVVDATEPQEYGSNSGVDASSAEERTTRVGHMHKMEHTGTLRHLGRYDRLYC
jgi:hypothetical protein